jgi:hypothetical protein
MDYSPVPAEWLPFEKVEPPALSWKRAKRAIATTTDVAGIRTIRQWPSRTRWIYGSHNNEDRVRRLCSTAPHGFDADGDPWYAAALYPAPSDPIYKLDNLVGLVTWVGHVGCLWPGHDDELMLPLVRALAGRPEHFVVPVFLDPDTQGPNQPLVALPFADEVQRLLDSLAQ